MPNYRGFYNRTQQVFYLLNAAPGLQALTYNGETFPLSVTCDADHIDRIDAIVEDASTINWTTTDMPRNNVNRDFQHRQEEERQRQRQQTIDLRRAEAARRSNGARTTYEVNGVTITALPNGDRDFEAELRAHQQGTSIVDQMRPLQEQYNIASWAAQLSMPRYTAGVDPYHGAATPNVHVYDHNGLTIHDLEAMVGSTATRVTPNTTGAGTTTTTHSYDLAQTLERYGHLLSAEDRQRLGYVAPAPRPNEERRMTAADNIEYGDTRRSRRNAFAFSDSLHPSASILDMMTRPVTMDGTEAYKWGTQSKHVPDMAAEQAAAELAAEALRKQQAEADEWLKNSPWG